MTKTPDNFGPYDDDDRESGLDRIYADPPYGPDFAAKMNRFRQFLADMIARRILAERRSPQRPDGEPGS